MNGGPLVVAGEGEAGAEDEVPAWTPPGASREAGPLLPHLVVSRLDPAVPCPRRRCCPRSGLCPPCGSAAVVRP